MRGDWGDIASPPQLRELILVVPGGNATAVQAAAERGHDHRRGREHSPGTCPTAPPTTSRPVVLAEEARAIAERHGL